ncbi:MAG: saccharopine dehydrogenase NADP-binding domain-containing protein [Myxococcaceae bacterium]|nr:saccharopine dehydrogenase NADP-binding domain-containing protein [Myxococcaceae bacterium]
MHGRWMIYGAYGYTGELIVEEAVRRGHRPTLAGRSAEKLRPLAARYELPSIAVPLDDAKALREAIDGHALVLHAAGPFVHTAGPMLRACLDAGAHYLDITGEIPVFEQSFAADREAREKDVAVISGVGFDVVPTDCLARRVAEQIKDPTSLTIAISPIGAPSAGTVKSMIEALPRGGFVRRDGVLISVPFGQGITRLRFSHGEKTVVPIPWGDLVTAFHTTGIPNITTYLTVNPRAAKVLKLAGRAAPLLTRPARVRQILESLVERQMRGPSEAARSRGLSFVYARAENAAGESKEAWLKTCESYRFTACASVLAVEETLSLHPHGALTPARAFGADFVLRIPETTRLDALPWTNGSASR